MLMIRVQKIAAPPPHLSNSDMFQSAVMPSYKQQLEYSLDYEALHRCIDVLQLSLECTPLRSP